MPPSLFARGSNSPGAIVCVVVGVALLAVGLYFTLAASSNMSPFLGYGLIAGSVISFAVGGYLMIQGRLNGTFAGSTSRETAYRGGMSLETSGTTSGFKSRDI